MLCALIGLAACRSGSSSMVTPTAIAALVAPTAAPAEAPTATPMPSPAPTPAPTAAPLPELTPIATPAPGVLLVDASQELGPISPYLFGTNYGPWVALRPENMPLAEQAGLTIIRYPGGEWGDANKLQTYQIDQFVTLCRQLGAEPYIHVRLPGSTPAEAAATVHYANVEKGYAIKYWSIGNEPSLYQGRNDRTEWDTAYFNDQWRQFAVAMKAIDPTILLLGPEIHQFTGNPAVDPKDKAGNNWMTEFLKANGDMVDVVTFHRYPFPANADRTPASLPELRANPPEWNGIVRSLRAMIRTETGRDLPVGVTEFNSHWSQAMGRDSTPDSFFNALWTADVLGRLMSEKVDYATQFLLVSGSVSGFGLFESYGPRPSYYVYPMYKMLGRTLLYTSSDDPTLSIYAARRDDGALTLMVINLGDETVTRPLRLNGFTAVGDADVWRFDKEHNAEQIDTQPLADGSEITVPGQSMTLYVTK